MLIPNAYFSVPSNVIDRPNHLMCHFVSCPLFCAALSLLSSLLNGVYTNRGGGGGGGIPATHL